MTLFGDNNFVMFFEERVCISINIFNFVPKIMV